MLIYLDLCLYTDINISLLIEWVTYCMLGYIRLDWVRFWLIQYTILGWTMGKFRAQGVHQTGQQSILVVIWSSSDVHSYPTKCSDALALTATDSGSGREEEKQTIQIFSISAFSSNSPTISFSGSSYFQKEKSDHGFLRLPDNFRIPLLKTFTAHQSSAIKIFMRADFILPQWVRWY